MRCVGSLVIVVFLVGCASVGVTKMKTVPPKPDNCNLDKYSSREDVKRSFEVVCMLDAKTGESLLDDKTVAGAIRLAQADACRCGGDGIIVESARREPVGWTWGAGSAVLTVIQYTD